MTSETFVIRSGLEPETYCLEGSCSIQLSYRTDLKGDFIEIGCKGSYNFANIQILDGKSDITAVIERVEAWCEALCGLEVADVEGIVAALFVEAGF